MASPQSLFATTTTKSSSDHCVTLKQAALFPSNLFDHSDSITLAGGGEDLPLDLSVRTNAMQAHSFDSAADDSFNSFESEVLNLSKKSGRRSSQQDIDKLELKEAVHANVSLAILQQQHELDGANLRNVLLNNGKLADDPLNFNKVFMKRNENRHKSGRGRKRAPIFSDVEMTINSNDPNNNILDMKHGSGGGGKAGRLSSPCKDLKGLPNGLLSNQNSPEHNQGEGLFTCDQCDKTFSKQSSLARHKYEHSGTFLPYY